MAKESIADVKTGPGLNDTGLAEFLDLAQEFSSLFTEAPETTTLFSITSTSHPMSLLSLSLTLFRTA